MLKKKDGGILSEMKVDSAGTNSTKGNFKKKTVRFPWGGGKKCRPTVGQLQKRRVLGRFYHTK